MSTDFEPIDFWVWVAENGCDPDCLTCSGRGYRERQTQEPQRVRIDRLACRRAKRSYKAQVKADRKKWDEFRSAAR